MSGAKRSFKGTTIVCLAKVGGHVIPKGPRGERRPAVAVFFAVMIGKGEIEDTRAETLSIARLSLVARAGGSAPRI